MEYIEGLVKAKEICELEISLSEMEFGEDSLEYKIAKGTCECISGLIDDEIIMETSSKSKGD